MNDGGNLRKFTYVDNFALLGKPRRNNIFSDNNSEPKK